MDMYTVTAALFGAVLAVGCVRFAAQRVPAQPIDADINLEAVVLTAAADSNIRARYLERPGSKLVRYATTVGTDSSFDTLIDANCFTEPAFADAWEQLVNVTDPQEADRIIAAALEAQRHLKRPAAHTTSVSSGVDGAALQLRTLHINRTVFAGNVAPVAGNPGEASMVRRAPKPTTSRLTTSVVAAAVTCAVAAHTASTSPAVAMMAVIAVALTIVVGAVDVDTRIIDTPTAAVGLSVCAVLAITVAAVAGGFGAVISAAVSTAVAVAVLFGPMWAAAAFSGAPVIGAGDIKIAVPVMFSLAAVGGVDAVLVWAVTAWLCAAAVWVFKRAVRGAGRHDAFAPALLGAFTIALLYNANIDATQSEVRSCADTVIVCELP